MNQLEEAEFQVKALLLPVVQIVEGAQDDLQVARQLFFSEKKRGADGAGALVAGDLQQLGLFAAQLGHEGVAKKADHLARQRRRAMTGVEKQVQLGHQL